MEETKGALLIIDHVELYCYSLHSEFRNRHYAKSNSTRCNLSYIEVFKDYRLNRWFIINRCKAAPFVVRLLFSSCKGISDIRLNSYSTLDLG